jgi:NADPH-dependent curcumin reductase CurA
MDGINRQWVVSDAPGSAGMCLERAQFARRDVALPQPAEGEVLIRNVYFACDPMNHAWVKGLGGRLEPILPGFPMCGGTVGRVISSRHPDFRPGETVSGFLEFADFVMCSTRDRLGAPLQRLPPDLDIASGLATLGMTGLCAYFGMTDIGRPASGETVVVSGAAGAIGTVAGQIGRIAGGRVIGIAGGPRKCAMLVEELGFEAAIDYKGEDIERRLAELCPKGIDVFFDNVGGAILDTALTQMTRGGRVVVCGGISGYNGGFGGLRNHLMLAIRGFSMAGFYYFDLEDRFPEGASRLAGWLRSGQILEVLDISPGFESLPDAALRQFSGENVGKQLVRICDPVTLASE